MPPEAHVWPSLFAPMSASNQSESETLAGLTKHKLDRALSNRKSLRHIVLLTNAFTSTSSNGSSNASSPTASFYAEVSSQGYGQYRQETQQEEIRRKEQEWFDALLNGMIAEEEVEAEDGAEGYVDISFREREEPEEALIEASTMLDSAWMEDKDFSAHTAFQIPEPPTDSLSDLALDSSTPSLSDLPELTRDNDTPEASPEMTSFSVNDLQLVPYTASPLLLPTLPIHKPVDLAMPRPTLSPEALPHALKTLRLPIHVDLPVGWDLQDFGPFPKQDHRPTRVLDDIYLSLPRRRSPKRPKASILVQSLLLS